MLIQSLRPQKFADVVGNQLNNKILMALAHKPDQSPSTLLLQGHFGSGKAIDVNSVLPTPNGNKRAGDIQLGEVLFSRTGQPTQVIGVYPNGLKDSYKVTFEDGRIVYCNTEHNWTVINNRTHQFETKTLQEIMDYIALTHSKVSIPLNLPVVHPEQELSITPYTLGLLLANAKYERGTILYPNNNQKYIASVVKENTRFWWDVLTNKVYRFPRDKEGNPVSPKDFYGDLYTEIVNQQTIPQQYLYASIDQRWELLQGIMDSLATISNDNNIFCSIPETLLDNFIILVHSLGLVVTVIEGQSPVTVLFKTDSAIIRKLFKNHRILKVPYNNVHFSSVESLTILSIEKEEEQREMVCFEVDNPEHLYLCNDYIVTHNTTSARLFAKALNCKKLGDNDICGKCENCKADLNCVPWYNEFDSSMLNVDSIRDMRDILLSTSNNYKKVVILDECLDYDQNILCKLNGEVGLKRIGLIVHNKLPVEVLSYNFETKLFEWKPVTGWHKNSKKPVVTRKFRREDNLKTYSLTSSENHRVFKANGEEVFVKDLVEGDQIAVCKFSKYTEALQRESRKNSYYEIPPDVEQFLLGTLLGDSSMSLSKGNVPRLVITQGIQQSLYFYDKRDILGDMFSNEYVSDNHAGWGKPVLRCASKNRKELLPIYNKVYKNGKKTITKELLESLTPLSLAAWYMDDGSLIHNMSKEKGGVTLSTYAFSKEENELFIEYMKEKYGITFLLLKDNKNRGCGWSLRANFSDSEKFLTLISPFVPGYFRYKLFNTMTSGTLHNIPSISYVEKKAKAIFSVATYLGRSEEKSCRGAFTYDLTVEDNHNYIANGVIVHNCHLLSKQSLSALLKVFEESPKNIFYLLATTDPEKLLPTIRSRSLELVFTTKTSDEVKKDIDKHAKALGIELSDTTLSLIATRSKGIMRNAHMLLDKVVLLGEKEFLNSDISTVQPMYNYIVSLLKSDKKGVLDAVSELSRLPVTYLKEDWQEFFLSLIKASIDQSTTQEEKIIKLASALPKAQVASLVRTCTADWVIKSFQSAVQAQAAMLSIFQMLSK